MSPEKKMQWLVVVPSTHVRHWGLGAHLDEELLAGGPLLPSKLARPGPVRAPSPPKKSKEMSAKHYQPTQEATHPNIKAKG